MHVYCVCELPSQHLQRDDLYNKKSQKDNSRQSHEQQLPDLGVHVEGQGPHRIQASEHPERERFQRKDLNDKQSQGDSSGQSQDQKLPGANTQTTNKETELLTCTVDDHDVTLEKHGMDEDHGDAPTNNT